MLGNIHSIETFGSADGPGQAIRITAEKNPADLKWNEVEAEYVVESKAGSIHFPGRSNDPGAAGL